MNFDAHSNLAHGTIQVVPDDASNGTEFTVFPGDEYQFLGNMPVTLHPPDVEVTFDNSEIGYVSEINGSGWTDVSVRCRAGV